MLDRGTTAINGPHQGGWVTAPDGRDWFVHFQDRDAYGRVVHLQPMTWRDDWPVIGSDPDGDGRGEPVATGPLAARGRRAGRLRRRPTSSTPTALGLQWQWPANPRRSWWTLDAGALRLSAIAAPGPNLWMAPSLLLQKWPAPAFTVRTRMDPSALRVGEQAGLVVLGLDYATLVVERTAGGLVVRRRGAPRRSDARDRGGARADRGRSGRACGRGRPRRVVPIRVRARAREGDADRRGASRRGQGFWVGARVGLFAAGRPAGTPPSSGSVWSDARLSALALAATAAACGAHPRTADPRPRDEARRSRGRPRMAAATSGRSRRRSTRFRRATRAPRSCSCATASIARSCT